MRALPQQIISLIHYVELTKAGWWETTVDRCVLATLWLINEPAPPNKIRKETAKQLDLDLKASELEQSLSRLVNSKEVLRLNDGRYKLSLTTMQIMADRAAESQSLEKAVKGKFEQRIQAACQKLEPHEFWASFTERFLIPLVTDIGARVYEFFLTKTKEDKWVSYIDEFLQEVPEDCRQAVSQSVFEFLDPNDVEITRFILSYLDAYFVISASGLPAKTASKLAELRKAPIEFVIFVDTNFVFSILQLHSNHLNETANDLMELVRTVSADVSVRFVISPVTLREAQQTIKRYRGQLGRFPYPPNLAEAASDMQVSGIFSTFFDRVQSSNQQVTAAEYFAPYINNLVQILADRGVTVFTQGDINKYQYITKSGRWLPRIGFAQSG